MMTIVGIQIYVFPQYWSSSKNNCEHLPSITYHLISHRIRHFCSSGCSPTVIDTCVPQNHTLLAIALPTNCYPLPTIASLTPHNFALTQLLSHNTTRHHGLNPQLPSGVTDLSTSSSSHPRPSHSCSSNPSSPIPHILLPLNPSLPSTPPPPRRSLPLFPSPSSTGTQTRVLFCLLSHSPLLHRQEDILVGVYARPTAPQDRVGGT